MPPWLAQPQPLGPQRATAPPVGEGLEHHEEARFADGSFGVLSVKSEIHEIRIQLQLEANSIV